MKLFIILAGLMLGMFASAGEFQQCVRRQGTVDKIITDDSDAPDRPAIKDWQEWEEKVLPHNQKMMKRDLNREVRITKLGNDAIIESTFIERQFGLKGPFKVELLQQDFNERNGKHGIIVRIIENTEESKNTPKIVSLDLTREDHLRSWVPQDGTANPNSRYNQLNKQISDTQRAQTALAATQKVGGPAKYSKPELSTAITQDFGIKPGKGKVRLDTENMLQGPYDERITEITLKATDETFNGRKVFTGKGERWYFKNGTLQNIPDEDGKPITLILHQAETFFE